ncbi:M28 family peptidase [Niabella drilacis]|uniref:Peptidase family M28 n=1 Tax=Niabella drilacis (strain DSM 25811 / CCM 8410 / CCUG 62505 / LMG 26954 / E90) TaxID=1285928 RepID=A0A1G6Y9G7_NIADE|nr:M28 family peptidase [Niabella drilacis]SDD86226.1 Peptidase family M28 [Niabella drilacis]
MRISRILFLAWIPVQYIAAQEIPARLNTAAVEKTIRFLAADEMRGRAIFSPEIDKAANFIAASFKKSGLLPLQGNSFLQSFTVYSAAFRGLTANADQKELSKDNVIVITGEPELEVTEKSSYTISTINAGSSLFQEASTAVNNGRNNIVLIDESFAQDFKRLVFFKRNFLKRAGSTIFILGKPALQTYTIRASHVIKAHPAANIAGILPGRSRKNEYVIFSAHYDHVGVGKPVHADSVYNGANDDASGTTAVMLLADHFAALKNNERSIIFVAFTAEESGGFGSQYFSRQLDASKIAAMLNIEMIGTDSKWGKNSAYITGFEKSSLGTILQKNLAGSGFTFYPDPYPKEDLFYRSDNATLARLGVPAHTISTSKMDHEPHYHQPSDEVATLDLTNMTEIIRAIGISAASIIAGKDSPTRVKEE